MVLAGCALPAKRPAKLDDDRIAIVVSERGPTGMRLVAIDEAGDRRFALIADPAPGSIVRDLDPAISPDGSWIAFASNRDGATSGIWIAPLGIAREAHRVVGTTDIDSHPAWAPDGASLVFASTRAGSYDIWRASFHAGVFGEPERLTTSDAIETAPVVARDGTIVFTSITIGDGHSDSHLEARSPDGTLAKVTDGPADAGTAIAPDGTIIFARATPHATGADGELWRIAHPGAAPERVVDIPLTDEGGPIVSPDGRLVFATSVLRDAEGTTLFSSVIVVDLRAPNPTARILADRGGDIARATPAIPPHGTLDLAVLARDREYLPELGRIVADAIAKQQQP